MKNFTTITYSTCMWILFLFHSKSKFTGNFQWHMFLCLCVIITKLKVVLPSIWRGKNNHKIFVYLLYQNCNQIFFSQSISIKVQLKTNIISPTKCDIWATISRFNKKFSVFRSTKCSTATTRDATTPRYKGNSSIR